MMNPYNFVLCTLLTSPAYVLTSPSFWNTESVTAKQGDHVNLTCTVPDFGFLDVVRVSFQTNEGETLTVADNHIIKSPFSHIQRYSIDFYVKDNHGYIRVTYQGIRGEDMGSLFCQKLPESNNAAEVKILVQVPVKEIYLSLRNKYGLKTLESTDTIDLCEMEDNDLECVAVVDGGLTPANLWITIGTEDKTQFFTASEESKVIRAQGSDLGQYYSQFKLTYSTMMPPREFNGLLLTCTAVQEGFNNISTSAVLNVQYRPVILCNKYEHHSRPGGFITVICDIMANPSPHLITWSMDIKGQSSVIRRRILDTDENILISETIISSDQKQVQLTIKRVDLVHFTSYYLAAENDLSSSEVTVVLLPASAELGQLPSSQQEQMMYLFRQQQQEQQQQQPLTDFAAFSSSRSWQVRNSSAVNVMLILFSAVILRYT